MTTYKIVRFYRDNVPLNGTVVVRELNLVQARAHCSDPESSSSTATGVEAAARTAEYGPWFDGYEKDADHSAERSRQAEFVAAAKNLLEGT